MSRKIQLTNLFNPEILYVFSNEFDSISKPCVQAIPHTHEMIELSIILDESDPFKREYLSSFLLYHYASSFGHSAHHPYLSWTRKLAYFRIRKLYFAGLSSKKRASWSYAYLYEYPLYAGYFFGDLF